MPQTTTTTTGNRTWQQTCRAEFNLTPRELATLIAIVAHHRTEGAPIPVEELQRAVGNHGGFYEYDTRRAPTTLWQEGLIERIGSTAARAFAPTPRGIRRAFS